MGGWWNAARSFNREIGPSLASEGRGDFQPGSRHHPSTQTEMESQMKLTEKFRAMSEMPAQVKTVSVTAVIAIVLSIVAIVIALVANR